MTMRSIQARLKQLEARIPPPPSAKELKLMRFYIYLQILAVGYYLGNPQPNEPLDAACGRAFGVENFSSLLKGSSETFMQHLPPAFARLLAKFEPSRSDDPGLPIDAYKRMADGFPDRYKERLREFARELGIEWPFA
jgi:hypothetical protein